MQTKVFAEKWRLAAGTDFEAGFHDCLLVAKCSAQQYLKLPDKLQPDSALFRDALRLSLELFQKHYLQDPRALHLLAAPVLVELEKFMYQQVKLSSPVLALWATHDTTILVLLAALGLWNGQWPPYTDTLVVEVYRETHGEAPASFFRFLHHGTPLVFPWCERRAIPGLCSLESFIPPWMVQFRNIQDLRKACSGSLGSESVERWSGQAELLQTALYAVPFAAFFIFIGHSWQKLASPRVPREALLASEPL